MIYLNNNSSNEQTITCHFCFETFMVDLGIDCKFSGHNSEIFDCEICCNPINIVYGFENQDLVNFEAKNLEDNF